MQFLSLLAHLFLPRHSNDHKAKVLHPSSLTFLSFALIVFQLLLHALPVRVPQGNTAVLGYASQISTSEVIRLTNEKRAQNGLSAVTFNQQLTDAAKEKGEHMLANDYWAHVAPDGTQPWYFFTKHGYKYRYAGENLARDFSNPAAAVDAWMASPSHKDNLLSSKYKEIGVAVVEGDLAGNDATIIVQLFGTRMDDTQSVTVAKAATEVSPTKAPTKAPAKSATGTITPQPSLTAAPSEGPSPTVIPMILQNEGNPPAQLTQDSGSTQNKGIRAYFAGFETTRAISLTVIGLLVLVMIIDAGVVLYKRVPRVSGRTAAHLAFLGMIVAVVIIIRAGKIL